MSDPVLSSSQLVPGYRLDRYELLCPIAQGGMAAVWLARLRGKHGFEKLVAVKTILPSYATDMQFRQMFLDEATIASRIEHGNVAQILDLGEQEGILYLVMEWVDGDSVSRLERAVHQAGSVIPQAIALRIASDSCAGLHAAHELCDAAGRSLGVVHRDVSPQNILVSAKGVVKLIDFGIAKARDRASEDTRAGVFKGKLHYMAPEQALGKSIDRRADVWAVAAVLYRLLSRRPVHDAGNRIDTLRQLTSNTKPKPLPANVAKSLSDIIAKALSFEPSERYESCAELQAELDHAIRSEALSTTTGELSAFVNLHLGEHFEERRRSIASSIQTQNALEAVPLLGELAALSPEHADGELTQIRARALSMPDDRGEHELRSEPTRIWAPVPQESSLTKSSTSRDAESMWPPASDRKKRIVIGCALAAAALLLFGWLERGSPRLDAHSAAPSSASVSVGAPAPNAAPTLEASAATPPTSSDSAATAANSAAVSPEPAVSVVSVESLALTPNRAKPRPAHGAPPRPKPKRKIIDDGF